MNSSIPCPICLAPIPIDPVSLANGARFSCPSCPQSTIGIEPESLATVKRTLDELLRLRQQAGHGTPGVDGSASPLPRS